MISGIIIVKSCRYVNATPVILSEGQRPKPKDLRTGARYAFLFMRRFFDSPSTTLRVAQNDKNRHHCMVVPISLK